MGNNCCQLIDVVVFKEEQKANAYQQKIPILNFDFELAKLPYWGKYNVKSDAFVKLFVKKKRLEC